MSDNGGDNCCPNGIQNCRYYAATIHCTTANYFNELLLLRRLPQSFVFARSSATVKNSFDLRIIGKRVKRINTEAITMPQSSTI